MYRYAVGDIQGCYQPLRRLLDQINFDPSKDTLFSVGDIVNRGPESLETLRFLKGLGSAFKMVLGNHDLHLLALYHSTKAPNRKDTLTDILQAPDVDQLCHWLQQQPLMRLNDEYALAHAGIPHIWNLTQALDLANEVEDVLKGPEANTYFKNMYGNIPVEWSNNLEGPTRWRVITNYFTRMRFTNADGVLDFNAKGPADQPPAGFAPWYSFVEHRPVKTLFGHWASLEGNLNNSQFCALDTGCVWGGPMRILDMDTGELHHYWAS